MFDDEIAELAAGARRWAAMDIAARSHLVASVAATAAAHAEEWAVTAAAVKGLPASSPLVGEEWATGPYAVVEGARLLSRTLAGLAGGRSPAGRLRFGTAPGHRITVQAFPRGLKERLLFQGFVAHVWMQPGRTASEVRDSAGLGALRPGDSGGVCAVLGAGNITSIGPLDSLYELVANNRSVILKLSPILDRLGPVLEAALGPLVDAGLVRVVTGGAAEGEALVQHEGISHVHVTGSSRTYESIVRGTGRRADPDGDAAAGPRGKPITCELGGVSPVIVVPGRWSTRDLQFQAEHVATMKLNNAGHNCIAAQVVVLSREWPQRGEFVDRLRRVLAMDQRTPWYPGSAARISHAEAAHPGAERLHPSGALVVPFEAQGSPPIASTEYFAPVLGIVELEGTGQDFLDAAVSYANIRLDGNLGATLLIAPGTRRRMGPGFTRAVADLTYGTIGVNAWTAMAFVATACPWGAFPGGPVASPGSGVGVVHNGLLLDGPERTVMTGPFRPFPWSVLGGEFSVFPKPPWFITSRTAASTAERLTSYAAAPTWRRLLSVLSSALRG